MACFFDMKKLYILSVVLLLSMAGCTRRDCTESNGFVPGLDSICTTLFPADEPGAEVLIMVDDSVVFEKGYGLADLVTGEKISDAVRFNIASCSKQFTAVAVLQLVEQGLLDLNDPVRKYFPELESSVWDSVQVRHLLSHSSGVPDERGYLTREAKIQGDEALATEYLKKLDHLHFRPGTAYEYINPTFVMLGQLVERVSGQEFTAYVTEHIFKPARMDNTLYFNREDMPRMAHGYEYADVSDMPEERTAGNAPEQKHWYEYDYGEETFFATRPDGGIYSCATDLVRWEQMLRRCLKGESGAILSANLLREAMSPQTEVTGNWSDYQNRPGTWYGYGWFLEPEKRVVYHTGDNGGFKILISRMQLTGKDGMLHDVLTLILANRADWDRYQLKTQIEEAVCAAIL